MRADAPAAAAARGYAGLAGAYLVVYFALNVVTDHRSLNGSSITLWSPDDALSVMLIMESWTFAPVLWFAQIAVDLLFGHCRQSLLADVVAPRRRSPPAISASPGRCGASSASTFAPCARATSSR